MYAHGSRFYCVLFWFSTSRLLNDIDNPDLNYRPNMIRNLGYNYSKTMQHKCMHTSGNLTEHINLVTLKMHSLETVTHESSPNWPDATLQYVFLNLVDCHLLWFTWILTVTGNITNVPDWLVLASHLMEFDSWLVPFTLTIKWCGQTECLDNIWIKQRNRSLRKRNCVAVTAIWLTQSNLCGDY